MRKIGVEILPILLAAGYVFVKGKRGNFSQTHA